MIKTWTQRSFSATAGASEFGSWHALQPDKAAPIYVPLQPSRPSAAHEIIWLWPTALLSAFLCLGTGTKRRSKIC